MANGFGTSPYNLPNMFNKPGDALQQGLYNQERRAERQYEIDYRLRKDKEADDWRKLNLIQELTDVDKYQTGEAVADALGNMKAQDILQKYTALAATTSPAELQARISHDIQNTASGMKAMRDELSLATKTLADLKARFPSVDTKSLDKYYRQDVINRRIENGEFKNPIHVSPTNMRFDDPDFLAAFVSGDKAIRDEIVNPKLVEKGVQVGMGSPSSYTMMKGDIPFFRERNFDPEKDIVNGFLKKGINPQMKLKSTIEKVDGKDVETLNKDAYEVFSDNAKLEFNALAARRNPNFYNLSREDRNKLTRQIALEEIQGIDQSGFSFGTATKPPHYSSVTNISNGGQSNINNIYKGIDDKINENFKNGHAATRYNTLSNDEQAEVKKSIENAGYKVDEGGSNVFLTKDNSGKIKVYKVSDDGQLYVTPENEIVTLSFVGTNLPKQADVGGKRKVVGTGNQTTPTPQPTKQKTYKGLDKNGNPIFE